MGGGPVQFLRSKVALALIGTCLIGGGSAILAAQVTLSQEAALVAANVTQNTTYTNTSVPTSTSAVTATSTTSTATAAGSSGDVPTATPVVFPTATPRPRPTATATPAVGQACNISGTISSISAPSSFRLHSNGVGFTIDVNGSTVFTGSSTSLSGLQVNWTAQVSGTTQANGSCLAATVNSSSAVDN